MYYKWVLLAGLAFLGDRFRTIDPVKGMCPFKDGWERKMSFHSVMVGTEGANIDILGKDSIVMSASDGRVTDAYSPGSEKFIVRIKQDTTLFTYWELDTCVVREGQMAVDPLFHFVDHGRLSMRSR